MDAGARRGVPDHRADVVGVREEQPGVHAQHHDALRLLVLGVARHVAPLLRLPAHAAEHRDVRPRRAVDEQRQRGADPDEQAGQGVEHEHAGQRRDRGEEVGARRHRERAARPPGRDAVEPREGRHVDELDHRRDHHRGEGGLRQALEEPGQQQQGHDGHHGHDEPRHLALGARAAVDRGLGQAAVDDHAARQAGGEVRGAEPEQLAVRVDVVWWRAA